MFPHALNKTRKFFPLRVFVLVGFFSLLPFPWANAATTCPIPPALRHRLQGKASADDLAQLGRLYLNAREYGCAADAFSKAEDMVSGSSSLAYFEGLSLFLDGRDAEALAPLHRAEKLDPGDVNTHLLLGAALDRLKRIPDAESEWRAALLIAPQSAQALDALSQDILQQRDYRGVILLLQQASLKTSLTARQDLTLGIALVSMTRLNDAAVVLQNGLKAAPDSLAIADELGMTLMMLARPNKAYAVFEQAIRYHPHDKPTLLLYLHVLVMNHAEQANQLAGRVLTLWPHDGMALYLNAVLEERAMDYSEARLHLKESIAANPGYAPSHAELGRVFQRLGDLPASKTELEKAIALGDKSPEIQYELARIMRTLGDTAQADQALRAIQEQNKEAFFASEAAGDALIGDHAMKTGDVRQAAGLYRQAIALNPHDAVLDYKLALALDRLHDLAGERAALICALRLAPGLPEAQNQMGYMAAHAGNPTKAIADFRAAIASSPSYVVAWINLAATLASESRWKAALTAVDHALGIDPQNTSAGNLKAAILQTESTPR